LRRVIAACLFLCQLSCSGEPASGMAAPDEDSFQQWALPDRLREISGLALTSDERLLAVADEFAVVYEIDYESDRLVKAFALGEPAARGDFEGIAVLDETVWLMTSDGVLYAAAEGGNGDIVSYDRTTQASVKNANWRVWPASARVARSSWPASKAARKKRNCGFSNGPVTAANWLNLSCPQKSWRKPLAGNTSARPA